MALLSEQLAPDEPLQAALRFESRRSRFRLAAERIRQEFSDATWEAFFLTAVGGLSPEEAAATLGKTVGAVYAARGRVMHRLRQEIERDDESSVEEGA